MARKIEPITVEQQILGLPVESIILLEVKTPYGGSSRTVLHRTGVDGWLATRRDLIGIPTDKTYFNLRHIKAFFKSHTILSATVLDEGEDDA